MRSIRGWIINLRDGLGPPPSSVAVHAQPESTNTELDLSQHGLGRLDLVHLNGGSISSTLADNTGHFGWDMELSPGPIQVSVIPSDPEVEFRRRFPDESAQYGKSFLSDLERLGWAGGQSGLIWDALPTAGSLDVSSWAFAGPSQTWRQGNAAVESFGTGANQGRFLLGRFIAMLGGVPFSVEMASLMVPIQGQDPAPANGSSSDRWDVYCLSINDEPNSPGYGKQSFEMIQGNPGSGIPIVPARGSTTRRCPLHALLMPAGGTEYTDACDLRRWLHPPWGVFVATTGWGVTQGAQDLGVPGGGGGTLTQDSIFNPALDSAINLPLGTAWEFRVRLECVLEWAEPADQGYCEAFCDTYGVDEVGTHITGNLTPGSSFLQVAVAPVSVPQVGHASAYWSAGAPVYQSEGPMPGGRTWSRLKFGFHFTNVNNNILTIHYQRVHWEVRPISRG